jgi:predicted house-cleaning NTP pyrophosphatase (Maf/HAM1 superfamily)
MLSSLSNETHQCFSAHILTFNTDPEIKYEWVTKSDVTFGKIPLECLTSYSETSDPYIHSGGYDLV